MKKTLFVLLLLMACSSSGKYEVPGSWDKDFSITLHEGGGMRNESTNITYTHDLCKQTIKEGDKTVVKTFDLTEADREEILAKLRPLNLGKIKIKEKPFTNDQESVSLCFATKDVDDFCLTSGAATEFVDPDGSFGKAYSYLAEMAAARAK